MSAHAVHLPHSPRPANLRPFDIRRDMLAVADLVELCFAPTLDSDGRQYINQMRRDARAGRWIPQAPGLDTLPMGLVWVEDRRVVGNLSLVPQYRGGKTRYLIANVAVHPDYQRRGIARQLTLAALDDLRRRGQHETWLQVDENNATAVNLYSRIGFQEQMRRTSWRGWIPEELPQGRARVRARRAQDWARQADWLDALYPPDVRWHLPLNMSILEPGLRGSLQRLFGQQHIHQWSAEQGGRLQAVLSWQSSSLEADRLWLAAAPSNPAPPLASLLATASRTLDFDRKLALNYPAGLAVEAMQAAGFIPLRTLIWMRYPWEASL